MKDLLLKLYVKAQALREERGQDMVEYALVVGIIALGATATMETIGTSVVAMWTKVNTELTTATGKI
jgi:Flp pilus assembly pilin Flp